ncbi:MAG: arginase [Clostridium sp. SCN 57-10]|nr:MAG: arginase [Clostridium sp. SCN 57-10]
MKRSIDIIGIQMDLGASKRGVDMGPGAIRHAGLLSKLKLLGYEACDRGDVIPLRPEHFGSSRMRNCTEISEANARLFHMVRESLQNGAMPIVLGGDHCVAAGSISAVNAEIGPVGVIWIDAHSDFHNADSTPSGNMHGMPLSAVCGLGPHEMVAFAEPFCPIDPKNVALVATRDMEENEKARLRASGAHVFTMQDIDRLGMAEVMRRAIAITSENTRAVHVSVDIDAVTPERAPGVGTPVHSGLTVREAFLAVEMLSESGVVCSMDLVEVNPMLDVCNRTGELACELILSVLGKSLY